MEKLKLIKSIAEVYHEQLRIIAHNSLLVVASQSYQEQDDEVLRAALKRSNEMKLTQITGRIETIKCEKGKRED